MQSKIITIIDTMTEMSAMVTLPATADEGDREILQRAGYSTARTYPTVILTDLHAPRSEYDAFAWQSWTLRAAHMMLQKMTIEEIMAIDGPLDVREQRNAMTAGRSKAGR